MVDEHFLDPTARALHQATGLVPSIRVRHRTALLGLRVPGHDLLGLPERSPPIPQHNREHLPGIAVVDHDLEGAARLQVSDQLGQRHLGVRGVMDHPERVHEIVATLGQHGAQLLHVGLDEPDIREPVDFRAPADDLQGPVGKIDGGHLSAGPGEIDGVGPDPAPDLEHPLTPPAWKLGEARDVGLDEVLAGLDLVEVLALTHWFGRVPDVAGAIVPVLLDRTDWNVLELSTHAGSTRLDYEAD